MMGNAFKEITSDMIVKAEKLAKRGLTMEQIAYSIGMGTSTLYEKAKENLELAEAIKRGKSKGIASIANALFESAINGNTTSMIFYLKCRAKWREQDAISPEDNLNRAYQDALDRRKKDEDGQTPQPTS
jgi:hypothetical protein